MEFDLDLLIRQFKSDADENLSVLEQSLLRFEENSADDTLINTMFRQAHSLKGNASIVGFDLVERIARSCEDVLHKLRDHAIAPSDRLISTLLAAVDALRDALAAAMQGEANPPSGEAAIARLAALLDAPYALPASPAPQLESTENLRRTDDVDASTLKVEIERLDDMLNLVGEHAIARSRVKQILETHGRHDVDALVDAFREVDRLSQEIQETVMRIRMVPVGPVFQHCARIVRDLAHAEGKLARLEVSGADVELDTTMITRLRDPLLHMIRNAVDHGIEGPAARKAAGKDPTGHINLSARHEGGSIVITLADDGAGLDHEAIVARARSRGLLADEEQLSPEQASQLIFQPGFSTAVAVGNLSGRGVGMDVVRRNVEALRGSVHVRSERGRGSTFELRLPLTLAIVDGFRVEVGESTFIVPVDAVTECLELPRRSGAANEAGGVLNLRGLAVPFARLRHLLALGGETPEREFVVIVREGERVAGIAVDHLAGEAQTVIKPLSDLFRGVKTLAGSAILGDGRVALILDLPTVLSLAVDRASVEAA